MITRDALSSDQLDAYDAIVAWLRSGSLLFTMAGFAGSGKTTLVSVIAGEQKKRIAFVAFTGKAASVLRRKLTAINALKPGDYCGTIHSLIYTHDKETNEWYLHEPKALERFDLIVADEASMIPEELFDDLASFHIPILAVGDHGQLPPVSGQGSLMLFPHVKLEKIHRQAEGNPIIQLSKKVRETGRIDLRMMDGVHVRHVSQAQLTPLLTEIYEKRENLFDVAVLTYTNAARRSINDRVRMIRGQYAKNPKLPVQGDQVICLRNERKLDIPLFNGMRGLVMKDPVIGPKAPNGHLVCARVDFPEEESWYNARMNRLQFLRPKTITSWKEMQDIGLYTVQSWEAMGQLFDFGYALTTHKSQGSSFDEVVVVCGDRPAKVTDEDWGKWCYTAVTRSSDRLIVVM